MGALFLPLMAHLRLFWVWISIRCFIRAMGVSERLNRKPGFSNRRGGQGTRTAKRRLPVQPTGSQQLQLFGQEEWADLPLVNALRADVERWRTANYRNATPVTRELLRHWARDDLLTVDFRSQ